MASKKQTLNFNLHPIWVGQQGWSNLGDQLESLGIDQLFMITDNNTYKDCYPRIITLLPEPPRAVFEIPAGERSKTLETCESIWEALHQYKASRKSVIINVGGGVVTDLGGFCASVYKRGIPYINVPTSLLGMVDAALGGKTGVDHTHLKNVIGSFYLPNGVLLDVQFLDTLSDRHFKNGMAELIKHALIADPDLWSIIQSWKGDQLRSIFTEEILYRGAEVKCRIVDKDPMETSIRKVLNFGHTIGHAIESIGLERGIDILHGEAIAMGMEAEAWLSHRVTGLPKDHFLDIRRLLRSIYPKIPLISDIVPKAIELMHHDKKNIHQKISFSLLQGIGEPVYDVFIEDKDVIKEALLSYMKE